jgi:hypothetical protein
VLDTPDHTAKHTANSVTYGTGISDRGSAQVGRFLFGLTGEHAYLLSCFLLNFFGFGDDQLDRLNESANDFFDGHRNRHSVGEDDPDRRGREVRRTRQYFIGQEICRDFGRGSRHYTCYQEGKQDGANCVKHSSKDMLGSGT